VTRGYNKLQFKLTVEFAFFFILVSGFIYFYFINSFENEALEKFRYKAKMISNYLVQNPLLFQDQKIHERPLVTELLELNDAKYIMLEGINGKVFDELHVNQENSQYYLNTRAAGEISSDDKLVRIQIPFIAHKLEIGKVFIGFNASETISDLHKRNLLTAIFGLSILLTGIILTFFLSSVSFKPLNRIIRALDSSMDGKTHVKIDYSKDDEMGLLASKINSVLVELDKSSGRVEVLNGELQGVIREKIREVDHEMNLKRRAEISLQKSENQFRLLFENAPIGMVIVSPEMKIEKVNKSFCDTLGFKEEDLIGLRMDRLLAIDSPNDIFSINQNKNEVNNIISHHVMVRSDNTRIQVTTKSDTIYDEENNPKQCILQVLDITEIIKVQQELEVALEKANESNSLKNAFLAQMSHEIRTPLNVILPAIPILIDTIGEKNNDSLTILNSVGSAGKRLQRTIDMILEMSKVQSGNYTPDYKQIDVVEDLRNILNDFKSLADDKGLTLEFNNYSTNSFIKADKYTVENIFQNLLDNAIKYTNKGFVRVVIEDILDGGIQVIVKDSGIGMNEEFIDNIFMPFSQEDVGQKREYEGTGLGLALVKKYSELNNAKVGVYSKKGAGSTFWVIFTRDASQVKNKDEKLDQTLMFGENRATIKR
jgi:PAS domain S-box-containing protein